jgi:hypothetical protein
MASASEWQTAYEAVVLEVDDSKLDEKVKDAEEAILGRFNELNGIPEHSKEVKALQRAIEALEVLRKERLDSYRAERL